jgi:tRNA nucleotidyltransferase/poly(A) polymerase
MKIQADFPEKAYFVDTFGGGVYAIGGYVRDLILERETDEIDLLITGLSVDAIVARLEDRGKVDLVGKSFGVIKFTVDGRTYDIALPRKDRPRSADVRGHKDFVIDADPDLPLEEDLERRDFRCNSLALRLSDSTVIDPLNGQRDIKEKKIRLTNPDAFPDDPLRVLRAARFASLLDFSVDPSIYPIAKEVDLIGLSVERITEELFRILVGSEKPSRGLEELFKLGALRQLFPELYELTLSIQDSVFHPETDDFGHNTVWAHTLIAVDQAGRLARKFELAKEAGLALLLAALYHDAGKPETAGWEFKRGRMAITNNGHDLASERVASCAFDRMKIYSWNGYPMRRVVLSLIRTHHRASELWANRDRITKKAFNRLAADVNGEIDLAILLDAADRAGRDPAPLEKLDDEALWLQLKFSEWNVSKETIKPLILGRDLIPMNVKPGPPMGNILRRLYQMQLDNEFDTREKGLEAAERLIREDKS